MAEPTPPTTPDTPLYHLIAEKLGRDPLDFIREKRALGLPFAKITDEIKSRTSIYLTHEAPRRWLRQADGTGADAADSDTAA